MFRPAGSASEESFLPLERAGIYWVLVAMPCLVSLFPLPFKHDVNVLQKNFNEITENIIDKNDIDKDNSAGPSES